jgi:hypothetical protein
MEPQLQSEDRLHSGAMTISQFCHAHHISLASYHKLKRAGLGPVEMRFGAMVRISDEAAANWRCARSSPSGTEAEQIARTAIEMTARAQRAAVASVKSSAHIANRKRARR